MNSRILLASPCFGKVDPEILEDWMALAYNCGRRMPEYDFFLGIKSKSEQFRARNVIVEAAQQYDCDRILMLDDDMVIDWERKGHQAYEFLRTLIGHDKDICGIRYYQRGQECLPVLMTKISDTGYRFLRDDEITGGLQQVDVAGGGCLLIKTKIFDRIPFPYFDAEHQYGTDVQLCRKAAEKGFTVWADTSIELGHMRNEKTVVTSRNRHQFQDSFSAQPGVKRTFIASSLYEALIADAMEYTDNPSREAVIHGSAFLETRKESGLSDPDWYREFPKERICRQVWFNAENDRKKMMTQFILGMVPPNTPKRVLDFGCGIGVTAFALAEKGHQVTACDIRGTGTLEFLKWRTAKYNVPMTFVESEGGPPVLGDGKFDFIVAMDSLEHVEQWRETLAVLANLLNPGGILFSNNAVLDDMTQPEHYELHPKDFIKACVDVNLIPQTHISYLKTEG
jgi:2-polyprenyl-3-methyl-5-hydroxy-6-metoxy-1,4-benzoquinol methylase